MSTAVQVHAFPRSDETFVRFVDEAMTSLRPSQPDELAASVHARYPQARIVPQSPLGALGGRAVWYVYRDGAVIATGASPGRSTAADGGQLTVLAEGSPDHHPSRPDANG
jgi:hypothetical protein